MGRVKEYYLRQQEEGWSSVGDKHVCDRCIGNETVAHYVRDHVTDQTCSYCGREEEAAVAAPMDDIIRFIAAGFNRMYDIPENCLPYDSGEGGWQGCEPEDSYDIIGEHELVNWDSVGASELHDDLVRAFSDRLFVPHDPFGITVSDGLKYSWGKFCEMVKHQTRFVIFKLPRRRNSRHYDPDEAAIPPVYEILARIGELVEQHSLVVNLPRGSLLVRGRQHGTGDKPANAARLGSPPKEKAKQSRMSPAGIPMFYAASDERTSFLETYNSKDRRSQFTFGTFKTARRLRILDLTRVPAVPDIFDEIGFGQREDIISLRHLAHDMSRPVPSDGREHYEYVPTQIAAEYFRSVLRVGGHRVDGIAFQSSRTGAATSYCLFADQAACADEFRSKEPRRPFEKRPAKILVLRNVTTDSIANCRKRFRT